VEDGMSHTRRLAAEGHLIDTGLMSKYLDIGRTVGDFSRREMSVSAPDVALLAQILENLVALGCHLVAVSEQIVLRPSAMDGTVPDDFYSTTNHRTRVFHQGRWIDVGRQRKEKADFVFMNNDVSSERRIELVAAQLAAAMKEIRARGGRTLVVAGPVVVHTGGSGHLCRLIRSGHVQALLSGNAIGVHDVESALLPPRWA
jgi:hypothetical protein